ncbi:nuclear poly(A) polymerase [Acrasis kona]|uniref:polynucleotide adenylyltransferase n=1 Tax=Acrasis kona TaxID=1008807 RepID=A0AAW2ZK25_9EUKA
MLHQQFINQNENSTLIEAAKNLTDVIARVRLVLDAIHPLLEVVTHNGTHLDLCLVHIRPTIAKNFAQIASQMKQHALFGSTCEGQNTFWYDFLVEKLNASNGYVIINQATSLQTLNGCRDTEYIHNLLVKNEKLNKTFQHLNNIVNKWAQSKCLKSNSVGYLGSYSWRLLLLSFLLNHQNIDNPLNELLRDFFDFLSKCNSGKTQFLGLNQESLAKYEKHHWQSNLRKSNSGFNLEEKKLLIVTPCAPYQNSARNLYQSTLNVISQQAQKAKEICHDETLLYEEFDFSSHFKSFIKIEIDSDDNQHFYKWRGYVISRIIHLISKIQQLSQEIILVPDPKERLNIQDNLYSSCSYIGLETSQVNVADKNALSSGLNNITNQFIQDIYATIQQDKGLGGVRDIPKSFNVSIKAVKKIKN